MGQLAKREGLFAPIPVSSAMFIQSRTSAQPCMLGCREDRVEGVAAGQERDGRSSGLPPDRGPSPSWLRIS